MKLFLEVVLIHAHKCHYRTFAPAMNVPKIPEGEKVDFDVSN